MKEFLFIAALLIMFLPLMLIAYFAGFSAGQEKVTKEFKTQLSQELFSKKMEWLHFFHNTPYERGFLSYTTEVEKLIK